MIYNHHPILKVYVHGKNFFFLIWYGRVRRSVRPLLLPVCLLGRFLSLCSGYQCHSNEKFNKMWRGVQMTTIYKGFPPRFESPPTSCRVSRTGNEVKSPLQDTQQKYMKKGFSPFPTPSY